MCSTRLLPAWLSILGIIACSRDAARPPRAEVVSPADPYHPAPRDTLEAQAYEGWKQYSLQCARCHGDDGLGTTFGPDLVASLRPDGRVPTREAFMTVLVAGRPDRGMPPAARLGLGPADLDGLYEYLRGRSAGRFHGGRPARR